MTSAVQNMSIKHKLISIAMATSIAVLLLAGAAFIICERVSLHLMMEQHLTTEAKIIADNCKAAVAFKDAKDAKETLGALSAESSIIFGCIYTNNGEIFADYCNSDRAGIALQLSEIKQDGSVWSDDSLTVFKPIILDGETIGTVCLRSSLVPIRSMFKRNTRIITAVLLLAAAAACMISSRLQRIISRPILNLAEVAKTVSDKKDYSVRAVKQTGGEIGLLIEAFNEMLKQIQQRDSSLESAVCKLRLANQRLRDFIHMAAHDLKSPLRAIGTLVAWLSTDYADKFDQAGREKVKLIVDRSEQMSKLIDGILQYSEITRTSEKEEPVNLNAVLSEVVRDICAPENIEITTENQLPRIVCEKAHITRAFQELLSNAVKYMDKPKGQIKIGCTGENGFWKFSVADNGRGIEEKYLERIFKMYQNLSYSETGGAALAIVKKIIEMYGGKIWVESKVGCGSAFFFTLPKQERVIVNG